MPDDEDFSWVPDGVDAILGSARPKKISELLKKSEIWHRLYVGWLEKNHPEHVAGWTFVVESGGRPRLQGRALYDQWVTALGHTFDAFYADVGLLKQWLDSRTGAGRKLAHFAGQAASAVGQVAQSTAASRMAKAVGADSVQKLATKAAGAAGRAVGPDEPLRATAEASPAPPRPARAAPAPPQANVAATMAGLLVGSSYLDSYLGWLTPLAEDLSWFGGKLGLFGPWVESVAAAVAQGRHELADLYANDASEEELRYSAYWLAYSIDLQSASDHPHHALREVVEELSDRDAVALYAALYPRLQRLVEALYSLYYYGAALLEDSAELTGMTGQLGVFRDELANLRSLSSPPDTEPTDADHTAARELFEEDYDKLVGRVG